jgi:ATP-binding cassette, subfamily B, bacterial PglK
MLNTFIKTYSKVLKILPHHLKRKFWGMQALIGFTGIVDLFGLAAFIPLISAVANPELLQTNPIYLKIKEIVGIQEDNILLFILFLSVFLFFCFRAGVVILNQWVQNNFVLKLGEYVGERAFRHYLSLDYETFKQKDSSEVTRELVLSPQYFSKFLVMPLFVITAEFLIVLILIVSIAFFHYKVFLILALTIGPSLFFFQKKIRRRIKKIGVEQHALAAKSFSNSRRGIYGFIDARLRNKEEVIVKDYALAVKKYSKASAIVNTLSIIPSKMFELTTVGGLIAILAYGLFIAKDSAATFSLVAIYAIAGYRIIPSLSKVMPALMQLEQYSYLFEIFKPALESQHPKIDAETADVKFDKEIKIEKVCFKYKTEERYFLHGLTFEIKKGEIIGLIGKSGSGKTTLVKIITGFLSPTAGTIKIDGVEINQDNVSGWMKNISFVQQAPFLEYGSLTTNIAFLESTVDKERLHKVIAMASLSELVKGKNPDEFIIEEEGKNLSGGQKQRVLIARALYNNSKLIILDEATSALDNETEREVNDTVKSLKGSGVTLIIIAHRYSTLVHTDRIIELKNDNVFSETDYIRLVQEIREYS